MFRLPFTCLKSTLLSMLACCAAVAVDGVILIDQNRALAGNVTPGDAPGFPVSITQPGSYKLSGNLTLPDRSTTGILLLASNVTIDLGGFAILGPVICPGPGCANPVIAEGITSHSGAVLFPRYNITIRNGTIQGMGGNAIYLSGSGILIEQMHLRSNADSGIRVHNPSNRELADEAFGTAIVRQNTAENNGYNGIVTGGFMHALVMENTARGNDVGILALGRVINNVCVFNTRWGLALPDASSYTGNFLRGNGTNFVATAFNFGQNLCENTVCPNPLH